MADASPESLAAQSVEQSCCIFEQRKHSMTIKLNEATDAKLADMAANGYRINGTTINGELCIVAVKK